MNLVLLLELNHKIMLLVFYKCTIAREDRKRKDSEMRND